MSGEAGALGSEAAASASSTTSVLVSRASRGVVPTCWLSGWSVVLRVKFIDFLEAVV